jgi:hypothetical protein
VSEPEPVGVRDLQVADRIARAVRQGRPADRRPTLEQLLAAFDEPAPTPEARRRAARALALAGVATLPDLLEAAPGERVALEVRATRRRRPLLLGLLGLIVVLAAAAALASTLDTSSNERAADLPAETGTSGSSATSNSTPPPSATASTPAATSTTDTTTTDTTGSAPAPPSVAERRRQRRARERRAREKRAAAAKAAARRRVTVRLTASQATFLCVEGDGRQLFDGTLTGSQTFRARVVRLNIGLGPTTEVSANGKAVTLNGSPTGVQITPKGHTFLALGSRPCA